MNKARLLFVKLRTRAGASGVTTDDFPLVISDLRAEGSRLEEGCVLRRCLIFCIKPLLRSRNVFLVYAMGFHGK
jgi:hypothetical protein